MKLKCLFFLLPHFLFFSLEGKTQTNNSKIQSLLHQVVFDPGNYENGIPKNIILLDSWVLWDSTSVYYNKKITNLPISERLKKLNDEHGFYYMNLYNYPFADTFFNQTDREFIRKQYKESNFVKKFELSGPGIKYISTKNKKGLPVHFGYSMPLFSTDFKHAVIRKYVYDFWNGAYYDSRVYNIYYEYSKDGLWRKVFVSDVAN